MRPQPAVRHALVLAAVALALVVPGAASGQDADPAARVDELDEQLEDVEDELAEAEDDEASLQGRLDAAAEELAEAEAAEAVAERRTGLLARQVRRLTAEVDAAEERAAARARQVWMNGSIDPIVVLLSGTGDVGDEVERAMAVDRLATSDRLEQEAAATSARALDVARERQQEAVQEAARATERRADAVAQLDEDLDEAVAAQEELAARRGELRSEREQAREAQERAARERAAQERAAATPAGSGGSPSPAPSGSGGGSAPTGGGGLVCPLDSPRTFTDSWGAPRSGGRSHRGTDVLGPYGLTVRAITNGTWDIFPYGSSAGNWAMLHGDDGNDYWYLHLQSHLVGDGARVAAGQAVATNGDTGNATGIPHIHFELHLGGHTPVNPYSTLRSACG